MVSSGSHPVMSLSLQGMQCKPTLCKVEIINFCQLTITTPVQNTTKDILHLQSAPVNAADTITHTSVVREPVILCYRLKAFIVTCIILLLTKTHFVRCMKWKCCLWPKLCPQTCRRGRGMCHPNNNFHKLEPIANSLLAYAYTLHEIQLWAMLVSYRLFQQDKQSWQASLKPQGHRTHDTDSLGQASLEP